MVHFPLEMFWVKSNSGKRSSKRGERRIFSKSRLIEAVIISKEKKSL
jgi:hypothetical protein